MKPVVAIDIDGTLGDFHTHFLKYATAYLGYEGGGMLADSYTGGRGEGFREWFCRVYLDDEPGAEKTWRDIKLAYRQGGMKRSMPIYGGAWELCYGVRMAGAELWLTTTRPYMRLDNIDPDTRFWLERHEIQYDGLLYDENKYKKLAEYVELERVVAVVDDLPEQIEAASKSFHWRTPVIRRSRWNMGAFPVGHEDLFELRDDVLERISVWKENHEQTGTVHSD